MTTRAPPPRKTSLGNFLPPSTTTRYRSRSQGQAPADAGARPKLFRSVREAMEYEGHAQIQANASADTSISAPSRQDQGNAVEIEQEADAAGYTVIRCSQLQARAQHPMTQGSPPPSARRRRRATMPDDSSADAAGYTIVRQAGNSKSTRSGSTSSSQSTIDRRTPRKKAVPKPRRDPKGASPRQGSSPTESSKPAMSPLQRRKTPGNPWTLGGQPHDDDAVATTLTSTTRAPTDLAWPTTGIADSGAAWPTSWPPAAPNTLAASGAIASPVPPALPSVQEASMLHWIESTLSSEQVQVDDPTKSTNEPSSDWTPTAHP